MTSDFETAQFADKIIYDYSKDDLMALVEDGQIILSKKQINDLKYKGECLSTPEQKKVMQQYDDEEIWKHIYNADKKKDYIFEEKYKNITYDEFFN
jgi:uncharacterized LabA/DUF88 family protein